MYRMECKNFIRQKICAHSKATRFNAIFDPRHQKTEFVAERNNEKKT